VAKENSIREQNEILSKKSQDLDLAEDNLHRLNEVLDAAKRELESLNERIPDSAKIGEFVKQVDTLMKAREVGLISLEPLPAVKEKCYTKIPIRLLFQGPFVNIYGLLHDLETMNRTLVMEDIRIAQSDDTGKCQVHLTASVFEQ
jgi:Tfp pilus assembly protein PilO